ncbi:MAG: hypothetical protein ACI4RG_06960 [Huintestinicola sp.]
MKIGEVQNQYSSKLNPLRDKRNGDIKKNESEKNSAKEAVKLELSDGNGLYAVNSDEVEEISAFVSAMRDPGAAKEQDELMENVPRESINALDTARRISQGEAVLSDDEQKLMAYNSVIYDAARSIASASA